MPIIDVPSLEAAAVEKARAWVEPAFLEPAFAALAREHISPDGIARHLFFDAPLRPAIAEVLAQDLQGAPALPHPELTTLDWIPRETMGPSALSGFWDWLASPEGLAWNAWLTGWTIPEGCEGHVLALRSRTEPAARWQRVYHRLGEVGGAYFLGRRSGVNAYAPLQAPGLKLEPRFNSLFLGPLLFQEHAPRPPEPPTEPALLIVVLYGPRDSMSAAGRRLFRPPA